MMKMIVSAAPLAVLLATPVSAQQRQPSPMFNQLTACQAIADAQARLACFDKATAAIAEAVEKGNLALIDREQVRKVRRSLFGFAVPKFPFFGDKDSEANEDEPKEIETTLRSFAAIGNGRYRVAITEPQSVWETTESTSYTEPRPGTKVTIKGGVLGSYFIQVGGNRWARARRVR